MVYRSNDYDEAMGVKHWCSNFKIPPEPNTDFDRWVSQQVLELNQDLSKFFKDYHDNPNKESYGNFIKFCKKKMDFLKKKNEKERNRPFVTHEEEKRGLMTQSQLANIASSSPQRKRTAQSPEGQGSKRIKSNEQVLEANQEGIARPGIQDQPNNQDMGDQQEPGARHHNLQPNDQNEQEAQSPGQPTEEIKHENLGGSEEETIELNVIRRNQSVVGGNSSQPRPNPIQPPPNPNLSQGTDGNQINQQVPQPIRSGINQIPVLQPLLAVFQDLESRQDLRYRSSESNSGRHAESQNSFDMSQESVEERYLRLSANFQTDSQEISHEEFSQLVEEAKELPDEVRKKLQVDGHLELDLSKPQVRRLIEDLFSI